MNPLIIIQILQLLPTLARTVKELIDVFERSGHGRLKHRAVSDSIAAIIGDTDLPDEAKDRLKVAVDRMIEREVALRNAQQKGDAAVLVRPLPTHQAEMIPPIPKDITEAQLYNLREDEIFAFADSLPDGYEWAEPIVETITGLRVARKIYNPGPKPPWGMTRQ